MPNWVYNTIAVKGSKKDVIEFIKKMNEKVTISDSKQAILAKLNNGKTPSFNNYVPMPKTFIDYDTTNYPNGKGVYHGVTSKTHLFDELKLNGANTANLHKKLVEANEYIVKSDDSKDSIISELHSLLFNDFAVVSCLVDDEVKNVVKNYANALYDEVIAYKKATKYQKKKYGVVGWYDWSYANYGVKWNADFSGFCIDEINDEYLFKFYCETAWNVPYEFLDKLREMYPNLRIAVRTYEEQPAFNGYFNVDDDDCWIENHEYSDWEDEELWDNIDNNFHDYIYDVL